MESTEQQITVHQLIEKSIINEEIKIKISESKKYLYISNEDCFIGIKITRNLQIVETEDVYRITRKNVNLTVWKTCNQIHTTIF